MVRPNLGVNEIRKITGALAGAGYPDFDGYALVSFKGRLERVLMDYNLHGADMLISRLSSDGIFAGMLVNDLLVETTELFRDPSMWRVLRDSVLPGLFRSPGQIKFWIPGCVSAEDPISLLILLKEAGLSDRSEISITTISEKSREKIMSGVVSQQKGQVSEDNYMKFRGSGELKRYLNDGDEFGGFDNTLLTGISCSTSNTHLDAPPMPVNLILFMDKMIYFNPAFSNKVVEVISKSLVTGGYLVLGSGESLSHTLYDKEFIQADTNEKIFRKVR